MQADTPHGTPFPCGAVVRRFGVAPVGALPAPATAGAILSCFWPFLCARPELFFLFPVRASVLHQDHRASRTRCLWPQCAAAWDFRPSYRNHGQSRQALTIRPMPGHSARCIHGAFRKRNSREYRRSVRPVPGTPRNPWAGQVKLPTRPTVSVFLVFQFACSGNAQYAGKHERCEIRVTSAYLVKNLP